MSAGSVIAPPPPRVVLDVDNATTYLFEQGLIDATAILDGALIITAGARRNRHLRVEIAGGVGFLVKQSDGSLSQSFDTLQNEAAFYLFCHRHLAGGSIQDMLPRFVHFDPDRSVLVLEFLSEAVPLWQHHLAQTDLPRQPAVDLGRALGSWHAAFRLRNPLSDNALKWLPNHRPQILRIHRPSIDWLADISAGGYQIVRILQSRRRLMRRLDKLSGAWTPNTLIHGDVRADNILVVPSERGSVQLRLVDWELVQYGDPAWDLAGAFQDLLLFWISTIPHLPETMNSDFELLTAQARYPLATIQAALRALWRGYRETADMGPASMNVVLWRAVQFSSVRLIQAALEATQGSAPLSSKAVLLLQIASNILDDPETAQLRLFGIPQSVAA
jgi:Ser/Thr protein kinase RdoA (MazF antagonist)